MIEGKILCPKCNGKGMSEIIRANGNTLYELCQYCRGSRYAPIFIELSSIELPQSRLDTLQSYYD